MILGLKLLSLPPFCFTAAVLFAQYLHSEMGITEIHYGPPDILSTGVCADADVDEQEGLSYFCGLGEYTMYNAAGPIRNGT